MRKYELAIVLHPDLEMVIADSVNRIEKLIEENNGKIVNKDAWGKRKLAYEIKHQVWGIYYFFYLELDPTTIDEINSNLIINEELLRFLLIKVDEHVIAKAPVEDDKDSDEKSKDREDAKKEKTDKIEEKADDKDEKSKKDEVKDDKKKDAAKEVKEEITKE